MRKELTPQQKEAKRIYQKNYYILTKEQRLTYLNENAEQISKIKKEWYEKNKEKALENTKNYKKNNPEKVKTCNNDYIKKRKQTDIIFKLSSRIRQSFSKSIKRNGFSKNSKTEKILGCSFEEFKQHIESLWQPWMNWDNYGLYNGELNYGWDIDHITPLASATCEEELLKLNHFNNLQPLCSKVNRDIKKNN